MLIALLCSCLLLALPATAQADPEVTVQAGADTVAVDGDYVRLRSGADAAGPAWDNRDRDDAGPAVEVLIEDLGAVRQDDHIALSLGGDVLFDFDSTRIRPDAAENLRKTAKLIRQAAAGEVYVIGHTDARGSAEANQELSEARAVAVMDWLHEHADIPTSILIGRGVGERQPVAPNATPEGEDNPEGRAQNRRVEILVGTRPEADLRSTVETRLRITDDRVAIEAGGVQVEAERPDGPTPFRGSEVIACTRQAECECPSNSKCTLQCPGGGCEMDSGSGSVALFDCTAGGCAIDCGSRTQCTVHCPGGSCTVDCGSRATCLAECPDGSCELDCSRSATCSTR